MMHEEAARGITDLIENIDASHTSMPPHPTGVERRRNRRVSSQSLFPRNLAHELLLRRDVPLNTARGPGCSAPILAESQDATNPFSRHHSGNGPALPQASYQHTASPHFPQV